jgi:hypothetical protein
MKPATSLRSLPWRDDMPDEEGYWWFRHKILVDAEDWGFVQRIWPDMLKEGEDLWLDALDISRMTPERWKDEGWQCCPVVLPLGHLDREADPLPSDIPPRGVPKECPECSARVQWTYLSPPAADIAYGCTACPWPPYPEDE